MQREKLNLDIKELVRSFRKFYSIVCEMPPVLLSIPKVTYRQKLGDILGIDETSVQNYSRSNRNWPNDPEFYRILVPGINTAIINYAQTFRGQQQDVLLEKWATIKEKYFELLDKHHLALLYLDNYKRIISNMCIPEYMSCYFLIGFLKDTRNNFIEKTDDNSKKFYFLLKQQLAIYPGIEKNLLSMDEYYVVKEILNIFCNLNP